MKPINTILISVIILLSACQNKSEQQIPKTTNKATLLLQQMVAEL